MDHKNEKHSSHDNHDSGHGSGHGGHHLVPIKVYINTLIALVVLTVVTVGASYLDFGKFNIVVSLGIATLKAALVMSFFMGLKYDNNLNRAFILSSFVALFLLIFFSASDLWTRLQPTPAPVMASSAVLSVEDFEKLQKSTPELVAKGKEVFNVNCAVCHGAEGKGDGVGGAALNPKPRNFHASGAEWKNGPSAKSMYVTLMYGIPGSGMASYKALSTEDRWALIHYIHTWTPDSTTGKADEKFAQAMKDDGIGGGAGGSKEASPVPIDFAVERILKN